MSTLSPAVLKRKKRLSRLTPYGFVAPATITMLLLVVYPILYGFYISKPFNTRNRFYETVDRKLSGCVPRFPSMLSDSGDGSSGSQYHNLSFFCFCIEVPYK